MCSGFLMVGVVVVGWDGVLRYCVVILRLVMFLLLVIVGVLLLCMDFRKVSSLVCSGLLWLMGRCCIE